MYLIKVLSIVDSRGCLDDIMPEMLADAIGFEILLSCDSRGGQKIQVVCGPRERGEWEVWCLIHLEERADRLLHKILGVNRRHAVLPQQFGDVPIAVTPVALDEDKTLSVPHAQDFWSVMFSSRSHTLNRQAKRFRCSDEIVIDFDKDGGSELDGIIGVVICIDGGRAATDVLITLVDGDVDRLAGNLEIPEIVCCRRSCGSSTCFGVREVCSRSHSSTYR